MNAAELFDVAVKHSQNLCGRLFPECTPSATLERVWAILMSNVLAMMWAEHERGAFSTIIDLVELTQKYRTQLVAAIIERDGPTSMENAIRDDMAALEVTLKRRDEPKMTSAGLSDDDLRELLGDEASL